MALRQQLLHAVGQLFALQLEPPSQCFHVLRGLLQAETVVAGQQLTPHSYCCHVLPGILEGEANVSTTSH